MIRPYRIQRSVGPNMLNHQEDVFAVKKNLYLNGFYQPYEGESPIEMGQNLFDSVQRYQKVNGLRTDGILHPGGETELSLYDENDVVISYRCTNCTAHHGGLHSSKLCHECWKKANS